MKPFLLASLALVSLASAQLDQLADIPSCAYSCFLTPLMEDGCSLLDIACHCKKTDLIPKVTPCVESNCSIDDQARIIKGVEGTCGAANAPISLSTPASVAASASAILASFTEIFSIVSTNTGDISVPVSTTPAPTGKSSTSIAIETPRPSFSASITVTLATSADSSLAPAGSTASNSGAASEGVGAMPPLPTQMGGMVAAIAMAVAAL